VADSKGFLGALFDFGFQSFVTPKVVKMLYVLIMIGTVVSALVFTIVAFKASLTFGVATLLLGDPLFILIVLAIWGMILEFCVVDYRRPSTANQPPNTNQPHCFPHRGKAGRPPSDHSG